MMILFKKKGHRVPQTGECKSTLCAPATVRCSSSQSRHNSSLDGCSEPPSWCCLQVSVIKSDVNLLGPVLFWYCVSLHIRL